MAVTRQGLNYSWQLSDQPIGSGDAGEVYAVTCPEQPDLYGVLKTPARVATGGTIQRQAGQIEQESLALSLLDGLPQCKAHPPRLLDESPEFTRGTGHYFIVSETAAGQDLASMLSESRKIGKPFPRRVIVIALDALFDLFARAHQAGILWNDVKLEHIYWHNPTGRITVIDWGNALFLNQQQDGHHPMPPRWEDYQQMVETLGDFLLTSAPELFADLGWDEFQGQVLDAAQVSVLARRIAYQQQLMRLKEMENQALIRVILSQEPDISGLEKITNHHEALEQIGAPCPHQDIVQFAQSLVLSALAEGDIHSSVRATTLVWNMYNEELDLPWYLARAYFRDADLLTNPNLAALVKSTFNQDYPAALWTLIEIAQAGNEPAWWSQLVPVIRQKALGSPITAPYPLCETVLEWARAQESQNSKRIALLEEILSHWRNKGSDVQGNPFEYDLLEVVGEMTSLPQKLKVDLKQSFAIGEKTIRELFHAWVEMNWDRMDRSFLQFASWDPDRWGIVQLEARVRQLLSWLEAFRSGPQPGADVHQFLQQSHNARPTLEKILGHPPWISSLLNLLNAANTGASLADFKDEIRIWAPWLFETTVVHQGVDPTPLASQEEVYHLISHFINHLKAWVDLDAGLENIKLKAPQVYAECKRLRLEFETRLSLTFHADLEPSNHRSEFHPDLIEAWDVLNSLHEWRRALAKHDLTEAIQTLSQQPHQEWQIVHYALKETLHWQDDILPILHRIQSFTAHQDHPISSALPETLLAVDHTITQIQQSWQFINKTGVNEELLGQMEHASEQARRSFLAWRKAFEHTQNRISKILYQNNLALIRQISKQLLLLWQHVQQVSYRFKMLEKAKELKVGIQVSAISNLVDHLGGIEKILVLDEAAWQYPSWQEALNQLQAIPDPEERRQFVLTVLSDHPMAAFLIQSQFRDE